MTQKQQVHGYKRVFRAFVSPVYTRKFKKNVTRLVSQLIVFKHLHLFSMSTHKRQYDVVKGLLNGKQVHTLTSQQIQAVVLGKSGIATRDSKRLYVLHDGCDIRKPSSRDMEYIGDVLSLSKQVVAGYKSMNSVAVDPDKQSLDLVFHELYSNKHPHFVSQESLQNPALLSPESIALSKSGQAINSKILYQKSITASHTALKSDNPSVELTHISDREFDDVEHFEFISGLNDRFITRLKLSRLSNESQAVLTPKGKVSKRLAPIKLCEKRVLTHTYEYSLLKLTIKGKHYSRVRVRMEWEALVLNLNTYWVLRITLFTSSKKAIFANPMLLITNGLIDSLSTAIEIYHAYLMRFKIEFVFKFLKQNLGLETIQIRDWHSIKNLLALVFFMVGYFKELETDLKKDPMAQFIADLALSKGKVTEYFLLKGIEKLVSFMQVKELIDQAIITEQQIDELFGRIGIQMNFIRSS